MWNINGHVPTCVEHFLNLRLIDWLVCVTIVAMSRFYLENPVNSLLLILHVRRKGAISTCISIKWNIGLRLALTKSLFIMVWRVTINQQHRPAHEPPPPYT